MNDWLTDAVGRLAREAGLDPATLDLSTEDARLLLDIARVAAHDSGERINAPLLCYLIGRMAERSPQTSLPALRDALGDGA